MLLKGAYCVGEHFVDPHSILQFQGEEVHSFKQKKYTVRMQS